MLVRFLHSAEMEGGVFSLSNCRCEVCWLSCGVWEREKEKHWALLLSSSLCMRRVGWLQGIMNDLGGANCARRCLAGVGGKE